MYGVGDFAVSMSYTIKDLIDRALEVVRDDRQHMLPPIRRLVIYQEIGRLRDGWRVLQWLDILTVQFVLPVWNHWQHDWSDYPAPEELVTISERLLRGEPLQPDFEQTQRLAVEMVDLTGEDPNSPDYLTWCVFEAAVKLFYHGSFVPQVETSDPDLDAGYFDVAHYAFVAYAGRIHNPITDPQELEQFWEWWYYNRDYEPLPAEEPWTRWYDQTRLPWTRYFDPSACLEFWEWWLTQAIPRAFELVVQPTAKK